MNALKRLCLTCGILVTDTKKCAVCKELAPVVKQVRGYVIDVLFRGKIMQINI